jgi:hypothetical protein
MSIESFSIYLNEAWETPDYNNSAKEFPYEYHVSNKHISDKQKYYEDLYSDHAPSTLDKHMFEHYTGSAYLDINENLWNHKLTGEPINAVPDLHLGRIVPNDEYIHHLSKAIDRFPPARENMTVYSGLHSTANIAHHIQNTDGIVHIPAFSSTSVNPGIATRFAEGSSSRGESKKILQIHIKEGQHVGALISPLSKHRGEGEFLLKPNRLLKIHSIPSSYICPNSGNNILVYHAHILDDSDIQNIRHNPEVDSYHAMKPLLDEIKAPKQYDYSNMIHELTTTKDHNKLIGSFINPISQYQRITNGRDNYELNSTVRKLMMSNPATNTEVVSGIVKKSSPHDLWSVLSYFNDSRLSDDSLTHILKNTNESNKEFVNMLAKVHPNYNPEKHDQYMVETK